MERVSVLKEAGVAPETHKGGTITVTPGIMLVLSAVKSTETHAHTHTQAHTCVNRTEHPVVYNMSSDSFDESFIHKYLLSASYTHTHTHTHTEQHIGGLYGWSKSRRVCRAGGVFGNGQIDAVRWEGGSGGLEKAPWRNAPGGSVGSDSER